MRELTRANGATLFTTLLAAFAVVLWKCSGQDTFAVGSLTSGRERTDVQNLVGLFANTVPIPADLSGNPRFAELLGRAQQAVLGALDHQDVSFEQIVTAVAPVREPARNPLFQVLYQLNEQDEENWRFAGLAAEYANLTNDSGKVDLALFAVDLGDELRLDVEYSTDLFRPETAARFAERMVRTLESVVADPTARVADVDILPEWERVQVTSGWNDTAARYPAATLSELFETSVRRYAGRGRRGGRGRRPGPLRPARRHGQPARAPPARARGRRRSPWSGSASSTASACSWRCSAC